MAIMQSEQHGLSYIKNIEARSSGGFANMMYGSNMMVIYYIVLMIFIIIIWKVNR
jgi:hypothetical protein